MSSKSLFSSCSGGSSVAIMGGVFTGPRDRAVNKAEMHIYENGAGRQCAYECARNYARRGFSLARRIKAHGTEIHKT